MGKIGVAICVIMVLMMISACIAFAGESTPVKASEVDIINLKCVYPRNRALALGIASSVFIIITRIYTSVSLGGASCCRYDPNLPTPFKICSILSWLSSVAAVGLLLTVAILNYTRQGGWINDSKDTSCYAAKSGLFLGGGSLAVLGASLGMLANILSNLSPDTNMDPVETKGEIEPCSPV